MDELKKALELAKLNRDSLSQPPENRDNKHEMSADVRDHDEAKSVGSLTNDVRYLQTQVIDCDWEKMSANKLFTRSMKTEVATEYKLLRTQVLQKLTAQKWNSLGVVSATSKTGNTTTAANLAIALASEVKHTVLLVDFNWRSPAIFDKFGVSAPAGIEDYLFRGVELSEILVNPNIDRLVLLGANRPIEHSSDIMGSPQVIGLIEELKKRYVDRIIIFDLPPALESDDAVVFAPYVDTMLMVVSEGETTPEQLERCAEIFDKKPFIGSVLNRSEP